MVVDNDKIARLLERSSSSGSSNGQKTMPIGLRDASKFQ